MFWKRLTPGFYVIFIYVPYFENISPRYLLMLQIIIGILVLFPGWDGLLISEVYGTKYTYFLDGTSDMYIFVSIYTRLLLRLQGSYDSWLLHPKLWNLKRIFQLLSGLGDCHSSISTIDITIDAANEDNRASDYATALEFRPLNYDLLMLSAKQDPIIFNDVSWKC